MMEHTSDDFAMAFLHALAAADHTKMIQVYMDEKDFAVSE